MKRAAFVVMMGLLACGSQREATGPEVSTEPSSPPSTDTQPVASAPPATSSAIASEPTISASAPTAEGPPFNNVEALLRATVDAANAKDRDKLMSYFATPGDVAESGDCENAIPIATSYLGVPYSQQFRDYAVNHHLGTAWKAGDTFEGLGPDGERMSPKHKCEGADVKRVSVKLPAARQARFIVMHTANSGWKLLAANW